MKRFLFILLFLSSQVCYAENPEVDRPPLPPNEAGSLWISIAGGLVIVIAVLFFSSRYKSLFGENWKQKGPGTMGTMEIDNTRERNN